jgi:type I restriction enzyme S subunit
VSPPTTVRLADIASINPPLPGPMSPTDTVSFVPMTGLDAETGTTLRADPRAYAEVCKGYTPFLDGDLLVAKITPCFQNGKIGQARLSTLVGFGSSEFHVLRPNSSKVEPRYLLYYLRQQRIRIEGERRMTGSGGQRRVPKEFLASLEVPLPPLAEQRRLTDILDRAQTLRANRWQALAALDTLEQSLFLDCFGDPTSNPREWSMSTVGECAIQVTDGEHLTPLRAADGVKLLSARNVRDGYIDFANVDFIGEQEYARIRKRCDPTRGDVLISCSGTIGRVASVETDEPFSLVRSVALVRPKQAVVRTRYLEFMLRTPMVQRQMMRAANASSQANLFQKQIRSLVILVPPMTAQDRFVERIAAAADLRAKLRLWLAESDALAASLQGRAFRGEL